MKKSVHIDSSPNVGCCEANETNKEEINEEESVDYPLPIIRLMKIKIKTMSTV